MHVFDSSTTRTLIALFALACMLVCAIVLLSRDIYARHAENAEHSVALDLARARVAQLTHVRQAAAEFSDEHEFLLLQFSSEEEVIHLLEQIEQLAVPSGADLSIAAVEARMGAPSPLADEIPIVRIDVLIEGSASAIFRALALIEALPKVMWVREARMELPLPDNAKQGALRVQLMLPIQP